jgi:hypothetical protein
MSRQLPPNEEDLLLIASLLETYIPLDSDLRMGYHSSMKGNTAVRIQGLTYGVPWYIDAYQGPWFVLQVPGFESTTADNHFSLITLLGSMLKGK